MNFFFSSAGDLKLSEGRMGVVRPFGKREIHFIFEPSFPGSFQEKLTVENVQVIISFTFFFFFFFLHHFFFFFRIKMIIQKLLSKQPSKDL